MKISAAKHGIAALGAVALAMSSQFGAAAGNSVTRSYVTPAGEAYVAGSGGVSVPWGSTVCGTDGPGVGGACFLVREGGSVDVSVVDDHTTQVASHASFRNDTGTTMGDGRKVFCSTLSGFKVPKGATQLVVTVGVFKYNTISTTSVPPTLPCNAPAPGTTGKITVSGAVAGNAGQALADAGRGASHGSEADPAARLTTTVASCYRSARPF